MALLKTLDEVTKIKNTNRFIAIPLADKPSRLLSNKVFAISQTLCNLFSFQTGHHMGILRLTYMLFAFALNSW